MNEHEKAESGARKLAPKKKAAAKKKAVGEKAASRKATKKKAVKQAVKKTAAKTSAKTSTTKTKTAAKKEAVSKKAMKKKVAKKTVTKQSAEKKVAKKKVTAMQATKKAATKKMSAKAAVSKTTDSKKAPKKTVATKKVPKKTAVKRKVATKKVTKKKAAKRKVATKKVAKKKVTKKRVGRSSGVAARGVTIEASKRVGQIASEQARFELGSHQIVFEEALGSPPPGYHLTIVRGWVRSPGNLVAAWDVNDHEALEQVEKAGWDRFCLRALDENDGVICHVVLGRRSGTWHLLLEPVAMTVRLVIGIAREDGFFQTLARSGSVRLPPAAPSQDDREPEFISLPVELDRRAILAGEVPALPGHHASPWGSSPADRLFQRIRVAATQGAPGTRVMDGPDRMARSADRIGPACPGETSPEKTPEFLAAVAPPATLSGALPVPDHFPGTQRGDGADGMSATLSPSARRATAKARGSKDAAWDWPSSHQRWGAELPSSPGKWGPTSPSHPFSPRKDKSDS